MKDEVYQAQLADQNPYQGSQVAGADPPLVPPPVFNSVKPDFMKDLGAAVAVAILVSAVGLATCLSLYAIVD
jgi:hypothetical protein